MGGYLQELLSRLKRICSKAQLLPDPSPASTPFQLCVFFGFLFVWLIDGFLHWIQFVLPIDPWVWSHPLDLCLPNRSHILKKKKWNTLLITFQSGIWLDLLQLLAGIDRCHEFMCKNVPLCSEDTISLRFSTTPRFLQSSHLLFLDSVWASREEEL